MNAARSFTFSAIVGVVKKEIPRPLAKLAFVKTQNSWPDSSEMQDGLVVHRVESFLRFFGFGAALAWGCSLGVGSSRFRGSSLMVSCVAI